MYDYNEYLYKSLQQAMQAMQANHHSHMYSLDASPFNP